MREFITHAARDMAVSRAALFIFYEVRYPADGGDSDGLMSEEPSQSAIRYARDTLELADGHFMFAKISPQLVNYAAYIGRCVFLGQGCEISLDLFKAARCDMHSILGVAYH